MKTIPLTRGAEAIIDDADYEWLSRWKWNLTGDGRNAERREGPGHKGKIVLMHRQIMGAKKGQLIDHINQNPLDNRRNNLRLADRSINALNGKVRSDSKTGYRGVYWVNKVQRYYAVIVVRGKRMHLGSFKDPKLASQAYELIRQEVLA